MPPGSGGLPDSPLVAFAVGKGLSTGTQRLALATGDGRILVSTDIGSLPLAPVPALEFPLPGVTSVALRKFFVAVDNEVAMVAYDLHPVPEHAVRHYRLKVAFRGAS